MVKLYKISGTYVNLSTNISIFLFPLSKYSIIYPVLPQSLVSLHFLFLNFENSDKKTIISCKKPINPGPVFVYDKTKIKGTDCETTVCPLLSRSMQNRNLLSKPAQIIAVSPDQIRVIKELAGSYIRLLSRPFKLGIKIIQVLLNIFQQKRLPADASSDDEPVRVINHLQVNDHMGDTPGKLL